MTTQTPPRWDLTNVYPSLDAKQYISDFDKLNTLIDGMESLIKEKAAGATGKEPAGHSQRSPRNSSTATTPSCCSAARCARISNHSYRQTPTTRMPCARNRNLTSWLFGSGSLKRNYWHGSAKWRNAYRKCLQRNHRSRRTAISWRIRPGRAAT